MTKKELLNALANIDDDAQVLIGFNYFSHYVTKVLKHEYHTGEISILLTSEYICNGTSTPSTPKSKKEFAQWCSNNGDIILHEDVIEDED